MASLHARAAAATFLALAALAPSLSGAADAEPQRGADQAWVYRQEVDGKPEESTRSELVTLFETRGGNWLAAIRTLDPVAGQPAVPPAVRIAGAIDGHGCVVDLLQARTLQAPPCASPPAPGQTWSLTLAGSLRREFKATGMQSLQVPAGVFEALRIVAMEGTVVPLNGSDRIAAPTSRIVYWYVPQIGGMARVERDDLLPDGEVAVHRVEVLESFGAASQESKAATRALPQWRAHEHALAVHARIATLAPELPALSRQASMTPLPQCRPEYPPAAIRAQAAGETRVTFIVEADGTVRDSEVAQEAGPTREHLLLGSAAQAFLAKCRFSPALSASGAQVASVLTISYVWKLR